MVPIEQYRALEAKYNQLQHELAQLKRLIFGAKSEKFIPAQIPNQLDLNFGDLAGMEPAPLEKESITYERTRRNHPGRNPLPENLPTEDIIIDPEEDTEGMQFIGEEITECVDYRPGVLLKRRYIRRKYARRQTESNEGEIVIGSLPSRPIPKGIAEAGLLAYLFVSKFIDHLPFYRLIEIFRRQHGWVLHKATVNDWFAACCSLLDPLYAVHRRIVLQTDYLQADESPIKVLDKESPGSTHTGYQWVVHNPTTRLVLFTYRKGRGSDGVKELFANFQGYLQCDGHRAYEALVKKKDIKLVGCMAHIRRKFYDALNNHQKLAEHALGLIQNLYSVEKESRDANHTSEERQIKRSTKSQAIFTDLQQWVDEQYKSNLNREGIGKALQYAHNQLPRLAHYLDDGRLHIDNNLTENSIRPLALGRKNYLFAGSHQGGQRAAMMYSFFASCKYHNVNPLEWLTDILNRISDYPVNQLEDLLPHKWKSSPQNS